ncbi:MAG: hypothetical protein R2932_46080 [Caldilineaceae bacterium]
MGNNPILLLITVGREWQGLYDAVSQVRDGATYVVIASNGVPTATAGTTPRAEETQIEVMGKIITVIGREMTGAGERDSHCGQIVADYPQR